MAVDQQARPRTIRSTGSTPPARVAVAPRTIVLFVAVALGSIVLLAAVYALALSNRRLMRRRWRASLYLILRSTSSRCRIPAFASLIASAALPVRGPSPAVALTMTLPTSAQARVVQQVAG